MDKCKQCSGLGVVERDTKMYECECSFIRRMAASMPTFIRKAEVKNDHIKLPIISAFKQHLMVMSSWSDMKAVIKVLMISNPTKFIRITSDREIRDVYVGSKSRAARGDEDGKIYNSLEDLMDLPDLSIVRLNELSYKNKAAPGALEEAVSYRTDRDKPTWLFNDVDRPFGSGSHAYSDSVADVIKTHFKTYRINRILTSGMTDFDSIEPIDVNPRPQAPPTAPVASNTQECADIAEEPKKQEKVQRKPKIKPSQDDDADPSLSMYGSGLNTNKFKRKF